MGAFTGSSMNLVGIGEPRRIGITTVTPELLPVLGVRPILGRLFGPDDQDRDAVVISYGLWRSQFGGDRDVVGRVVNLDGGPRTIIGVMPRSFYFPNRDTEMWSALTFVLGDYESRDNSYIEGVGRLKPGVTFASVVQAMEKPLARAGCCNPLNAPISPPREAPHAISTAQPKAIPSQRKSANS
jgi:hypothetical protein